MGISVHTNQSALIALQNLNSTNEKLSEVQGRISTGLRIANAKDKRGQPASPAVTAARPSGIATAAASRTANHGVTAPGDEFV